MIGLLGSLLGGQGGRLAGGMIGGRTGAMIGGLAGAMLGGRGIGKMLRGAKGKLTNDGSESHDPEASLSDADAALLVKAMVNSAKADGVVDQQEIDQILAEVGEVDAAEKRFLETELAAPVVTPADFAREVPEERRDDVYVVSLMATKADTPHEVSYLVALGDAMGIDESARHQIHDQLGIARL